MRNGKTNVMYKKGAYKKKKNFFLYEWYFQILRFYASSLIGCNKFENCLLYVRYNNYSVNFQRPSQWKRV